VGDIQRATETVRGLTEAGAAAVERQRVTASEMSTASTDAARAVQQMQDGIEQVATECFTLSTAVEALTSGAEIMVAKVAWSRDAA
jgi:methyl-accepting chemotaxis protein